MIFSTKVLNNVKWAEKLIIWSICHNFIISIHNEKKKLTEQNAKSTRYKDSCHIVGSHLMLCKLIISNVHFVKKVFCPLQNATSFV